MLAVARLSTALSVIKSCEICQDVSIVSHHVNFRLGWHCKRLVHGRGMADIVLDDTGVLNGVDGVKELCDANIEPKLRSTVQASNHPCESERKKLKIEPELPKEPVGFPRHSPSDVKRTAKKRFTPYSVAMSCFCTSLLCLVHFRNKSLTKTVSRRPTHFVAARVSHSPSVIKAMETVQEALRLHNPALHGTFVEPVTSHLTLMVRVISACSCLTIIHRTLLCRLAAGLKQYLSSLVCGIFR